MIEVSDDMLTETRDQIDKHMKECIIRLARGQRSKNYNDMLEAVYDMEIDINVIAVLEGLEEMTMARKEIAGVNR